MLIDSLVLNDFDALIDSLVLNDFDALIDSLVLNDFDALIDSLVLNDFDALIDSLVLNDFDALIDSLVLNDFDELSDSDVLIDALSLTDEKSPVPVAELRAQLIVLLTDLPASVVNTILPSLTPVPSVIIMYPVFCLLLAVVNCSNVVLASALILVT